MVTPPAGAIGRGDGFILRIAEKSGALVLSNDSFQEFHAERPWLFEPGRLIGGKPVPGVGWVFTPRTPVRGPKSRVAVSRPIGGRRRCRDRLDGQGTDAVRRPRRSSHRRRPRTTSRGPTTRGPIGQAPKLQQPTRRRIGEAAKTRAESPKPRSRRRLPRSPTKVTKVDQGGEARQGEEGHEGGEGGQGGGQGGQGRGQAGQGHEGGEAGQGGTGREGGQGHEGEPARHARWPRTATKDGKAAKANGGAATKAASPRRPRRPEEGRTPKSAKKSRRRQGRHGHQGRRTRQGRQGIRGRAGNAKVAGQARCQGEDGATAAGSSALNDPMTFLTFVADHPVGSTVEGTVVSFTSHGAHIEVGGHDLPRARCAGWRVRRRHGRARSSSKGETRRFVARVARRRAPACGARPARRRSLSRSGRPDRGPAGNLGTRAGRPTTSPIASPSSS